jgi:hypothetical protein
VVKEDFMELRWGSSVGAALLLLGGLLIAWPVVGGMAYTSEIDTRVRIDTAILDDLIGVPEATVEAQPGQLPSASTESTGTTAKPSAPLTDRFVDELLASRLFVSANGERVLGVDAGLGSPRQLVLAQRAADRFGVMNNPYFDPRRAAVIRDGQAVVELTTGVILGHEFGSSMFGTTEVIGPEMLEELRENVGWSLTAAREAEAARYERLIDYIPVYLQSDEAFATYNESARSNYLALAATG